MPDSEKKKYEVAFVDVSDTAQTQARDVAEAKMTADKEQLKGVKGFLKRIWHHNIAHEYYRQKEIKRARGEILETKNIYAGKTTDLALHEQAMAATVERFTSEYEETTVHKKDAGEEKKSIEEELGRESGAVKAEIRDLISQYAQGGIDEANFLESKNRIFSRIKGVPVEQVRSQSIYADNLLEIAKQVQQSYEHSEGLDRLDFDLDVTVGKAKTGVRTEAQFSAVDRITEKMQKIPLIGKWISETSAAAVAVAVAYSAGKTILQRVAGSRAFAIATFGGTAAIAGGVAAMRESKRLEEERRQHSREMAQGGKFAEGADRRKEMEKFRYETKDSSELLHSLQANLLSDERQEFNQEGIENAISSLAEIEARIKLSDRQKIDLISYSNYGVVEKERLDLDIARAKAKIKLRDILASSGNLPEGKSADQFLEDVIERRTEDLTKGDQGIESRNKRFKEMKKGRVFKTAVRAVGIGLLIGGTAQEAMAFANEEQEGLVEHLIRGDAAKPTGATAHYTPAESLRRYISGDTPKLDPGKAHEAVVGNHHIKLPEGADFTDADGDADYELRVGDKVLVDDLKFGPDGQLTPESKEALAAAGVTSHESTQTIMSETQVAGHLDNEGILEKYKDLVKNTARDLWYDNDTPKPVFDKNELKLWWGGSSGTGIDAGGNYVFDVRHMAPDGSYHDDFSVDAQEAFADGRLKMAFSLSQETQKHVFDVPINSDGQAIIDPNSEIGKMFFEQVDGKAVFKGRFAEVFESFGPDDQGIEHVRVLATHEGGGIDGIDALVPQQVEEQVPVTAFDVPRDYVTDLPPVIPILGRRPLEPIKEKEAAPRIPLPQTDAALPPGYYAGRRRDGYAQEGERDEHYQNPYGGVGDTLEKFKPSHTRQEIEALYREKNYPELRKVLTSLEALENPASLAGLYARYEARRPKSKETPEQFKKRMEEVFLKMARNVLLDKAAVGEKPFSPEFYENSKFIQGLTNAEEVVVMYDPPLDDTILDLPIVTSLEKYFALAGQKKKIVIVSGHSGLLRDFAKNNPDIEIVSDKDIAARAGTLVKPYIINDNRDFGRPGNPGQPEVFGLSAEDLSDESKALNVHDFSFYWSLEQSPDASFIKKAGLSGYKQYYALPARVMRNMELFLGTKLYKDINKMEGFWPPVHDFESRSEKMRADFGLEENSQILTISLGSSIMPKEYEPAKWQAVLREFCRTAGPELKIVIMRDPDKTKAEKYQKELIDALPDEIKNRIVYEKVDLADAPVLIKMSKAVLTPDTRVGHIASSMGVPNILLHINNPVLWSSAKSKRITGAPARRAYKEGDRDFSEGWTSPNKYTSYYVLDRAGKMEGASNIEPERVVNALNGVFGAAPRSAPGRRVGRRT